MAEPVLCVDFGSTFTKVLAVDTADGRVLGTAAARTTVDSDILQGLHECRGQLAARLPDIEAAEVLACSSAGGGLRIAVVGNEDLVTAEAGRRVALSSGGRVVAVLAASRGDDLSELTADDPDVVLLTGGTDGGNSEQLLRCAAELGECWSGPVVVAGNSAVQDQVARLLAGRSPYLLADNVVPRIGVFTPDSARTAIREMFLRHVIGGKHLSQSPAFAQMVLGATPDVVLSGVEVLARSGEGTDVCVVDVGGATTDVHSVIALDPEDGELGREVVATAPTTRTVEGDLGMRWSAPATVHAAGLDDLAEAAERRHGDPGFLPADDVEAGYDEAIAAAAVRLALRRHAGRRRVVLGPSGRVLERTGTDLREVGLLIASGGVFRHGRPGVVDRVLAGCVGADDEGWLIPRDPRIVVDSQAALAAIGLLSLHGRHSLAEAVAATLTPGKAAPRPADR